MVISKLNVVINVVITNKRLKNKAKTQMGGFNLVIICLIRYLIMY